MQETQTAKYTKIAALGIVGLLAAGCESKSCSSSELEGQAHGGGRSARDVAARVVRPCWGDTYDERRTELKRAESEQLHLLQLELERQGVVWGRQRGAIR